MPWTLVTSLQSQRHTTATSTEHGSVFPDRHSLYIGLYSPRNMYRDCVVLYQLQCLLSGINHTLMNYIIILEYALL